MNKILRNFLITCGVLVVLGFGLYLYIQKTSKVAPSSVAGSQASTTSQTLSDGTVVTGLPDGAVVHEEVVKKPTVPAPDYKRPIDTSALPSELQTSVQAHFDDVKAGLAKNPTSFDTWIQLGILRQMAKDYTGAAEVYAYASVLYPGSEVPYNNLGYLYMNFIKDYPKAEANYKKAISINPRGIDYYQSLYYLYRDIYKDTAKAKAILEQGLASNPNNNTLLYLKTQS